MTMSPTLVSSNTDMMAARTQTGAAKGHARVRRCARIGVTRRRRRGRSEGGSQAVWRNGSWWPPQLDARHHRGADHERARPLREGSQPRLLLQPALSRGRLPCLPRSLHICDHSALTSRISPSSRSLVSPMALLESNHSSPRYHARTSTSRLFCLMPMLDLPSPRESRQQRQCRVTVEAAGWQACRFD